MKPFVPLLAFAVLLGGCASSAETSDTVKVTALFDLDLPYADRDQVSPAFVDRTLVTRVPGLTSRQVRKLLGSPSDRLTRDLWVYWNFHDQDEARREHGGYETLLIAFADDKVTAAKLVRGEDLRATLARRKPVYAQQSN